jgi:hypothetical protein
MNFVRNYNFKIKNIIHMDALDEKQVDIRHARVVFSRNRH